MSSAGSMVTRRWRVRSEGLGGGLVFCLRGRCFVWGEWRGGVCEDRPGSCSGGIVMGYGLVLY